MLRKGWGSWSDRPRPNDPNLREVVCFRAPGEQGSRMDVSRSAQTLYNDFYGMLSDSVRMEAFREAIQQVVKPGDVVVDLGAGTGILGFLALQAGAAKVFAIEQSDSMDLAKAVAAKNGMSDRIDFLNKNSKDVTLPVQADVIVSETLGSFGVDENTLEFTLDARDPLSEAGRRPDSPGFAALPRAGRIETDLWQD